MPKEAREKATAEINKLKMMSPMSAEATVIVISLIHCLQNCKMHIGERNNKFSEQCFKFLRAYDFFALFIR